MSPLSSDGGARSRQLANLRRGGDANAGSFRPGHPGPRLKHGGYAERVGPLVLSDKAKEILAAIAQDNPALLDADGEPHGAFVPALQAAALAALQVEHLRYWLVQHGVADERDRWRPENELLDRKLGSYVAMLDRLGATPTALARLGLDVARTEREQLDLAAFWQRETQDDGRGAPADVDGQAADLSEPGEGASG